MYAAKRAGKGQVAMYDSSMVLPEVADLHYRPLLIDAMKAGDIDCVFQPIIDLKTGRLHSMEALARWEVGGTNVDQSYFIKLAGRLGLLPTLTDHMLDVACRQLADWSTRFGLTDLQVGVNVPPGLMTDKDFPERVAVVLRRHRLGADRLILEITEDALLGDTAIARSVSDQLRRSGVNLWLDDFGTGYSSLLSLRQIALQSVKIDIAFVANIHTDPEAERFLRALLVLARDLDLLVTAEGVERPEQEEILRSLGCQLGQGYLYARPVPAPELDYLLCQRGATGLAAAAGGPCADVPAANGTPGDGRSAAGGKPGATPGPVNGARRAAVDRRRPATEPAVGATGSEPAPYAGIARPAALL